MDKQILGAFIAENRRRRHLTQQQLAQMLHVTDKAVSKWERGLSYPDVTLLEPLATALGLTAAALLRCAAPAEEKEQAMEEKKYPAENETLRAVVEMADNNQKRQRRQWLTGVSAAAAAFLLIIALFAIRHIHLDLTNPYRYTEELCGLIQQAEYTADGTWLYVTDAGSLSSDLLKLRCPADMDTSTLQIGWRYVNSILSHPQYHVAYDRRTNEITWCDELPEYLTVTAIGGFGGSPAQPMEKPLFGFEETFSAHLDGYGATYFFIPIPEQPEQRQVLMLLPDAGRRVDYRVEDVDGDGINELLLTDLGGERPYTLCDVDVTGQLVTQLYSIWE